MALYTKLIDSFVYRVIYSIWSSENTLVLVECSSTRGAIMGPPTEEMPPRRSFLKVGRKTSTASTARPQTRLGAASATTSSSTWSFFLSTFIVLEPITYVRLKTVFFNGVVQKVCSRLHGRSPRVPSEVEVMYRKLLLEDGLESCHTRQSRRYYFIPTPHNSSRARNNEYQREINSLAPKSIVDQRANLMGIRSHQ